MTSKQEALNALEKLNRFMNAPQDRLTAQRVEAFARIILENVNAFKHAGELFWDKWHKAEKDGFIETKSYRNAYADRYQDETKAIDVYNDLLREFADLSKEDYEYVWDMIKCNSTCDSRKIYKDMKKYRSEICLQR